ncbi:MAG: hypothetical protein ACYDCN_06250 [Bacteroidia bacterium]
MTSLKRIPFLLCKKSIIFAPQWLSASIINSIEEGKFTSFIIEGEGEREWAKIWDTENETYAVRFLYMCTKTEKEMEAILQIINSLEEPPEN